MTEGDGAVGADERYELGLAIRKEVLGEAHVERSLAAVSDFSRPVQELSPAPAGATSGAGQGWTGAPEACSTS
jgi:hypothetical protein